jgi:hypothetical protein
MLANEGLEFGHNFGVTAEREVGLETLLECNESKSLEPPDLVPRELVVAELHQRRAPPEAERLTQDLSGFGRLALGEEAAAARDQALENHRVENARLESKQVPGRVCLDPSLSEQLAQL